MTQHNRYFRYFLIVLLAIASLKIALSIFIPVTGDEAYYTIWGQYPALGYYDHPPLIGWLMSLVLHLGQSPFIVRLPAILVTLIIGVGIYALLRPYDANKAALIAILYLIAPPSFGNIIITTDTPLLLASFLSGALLFLAIKHQDNLFYYFLAGVFLGLAFFAKYFAVLLALAYLVYFMASPKTPKRWLGFGILFLCVLPFGLENLYWNYTHAWSNILFNVFNRNEDASFSWHTLFTYVFFIFYLITPAVFYYLLRYGKSLFVSSPRPEFKLLSFLFLIPLAFFLLLSLVKKIGLHWPLSFIPFVYLALFICLDQEKLKSCLKFTAWFSFLHLLLVAIIIFTPIQTWKKLGLSDKKYADLVFLFKHQEVSNYLHQYNNDYIIASPTYSKADIIHFDGNNYSPTFGPGTVHGRQDDFITDFKPFAHKNFVIFYAVPPSSNDYKAYFDKTEIRPFTIYGANFYAVLAYNFNYEKYRDTVLRNINNHYWHIPSFLPHKPSFYCQKYFPETECMIP